MPLVDAPHSFWGGSVPRNFISQMAKKKSACAVYQSNFPSQRKCDQRMWVSDKTFLKSRKRSSARSEPEVRCAKQQPSRQMVKFDTNLSSQQILSNTF